MGSRVIAVFDFDKTLTAGRSVERSFFEYLLRSRKLKVKNIVNALIYFMMNIFKSPDEALKRNKMYLKGVASEQAMLWIRGFIEECGDRLISKENFQLVKSHRGLGHCTILLSGAPGILIEALNIRSWFDLVYTTYLESIQGVYTGHIDGTHYYGKEKADLVMHIRDELDADLSRSFCYADSIKDAEMMSLFGYPVAVNPDRELIKIALERNWKILK